LSSGAKAYEVLGDEKYLRAIRNAWDMIEQTQQYASGAWAPKEAFVKPHSGELAASLTTTRDHFETPCCFYAHAKLARYLMGFTGDAQYGDGLERVLLNTILGALDPDDDGGGIRHPPAHSGLARTARADLGEWQSCSREGPAWIIRDAEPPLAQGRYHRADAALLVPHGSDR
ncbi:MAG: hypothetical protein H6R26_3549, partial [Proteobacteria bacterium]|nr:hypothetical protein [Pseudomonadota bacterium]